MDVRQPDGNHDPRDDGNLRSDHGLLGVRARDADCSLRLGERDVQWLGRRGRRLRLLLWPFGLLRRGRAGPPSPWVAVRAIPPDSTWPAHHRLPWYHIVP